jgi:aminoglycoside phosphotransferase family enzyme
MRNSTAPALYIRTEDYLNQLQQELQMSRDALAEHKQELNGQRIKSVIANATAFIKDNLSLFSDRLQSGRVIEGHGDLRPEHICLKEDPVIIDCLEFNRDLRIVAPCPS